MIVDNIDRDSPIPAYYQIAMDLKDRVTRQEWAAKDQLPSEGKLAQEYAVSRITVRQALAELEKDGLITKMRGRNAVINKHPRPFVHKLNYAIVSADRFGKRSDDMTAEVLSLERYDTPHPDVVTHLRILEDTPVVFIKRRFFLGGKPIAICRSWLSLEQFPDLYQLGLIDGQLSATLTSRYGVEVDWIDDSLEAVRSTLSECQLLQTSTDCPLLLLTGISYTKSGIPIEYSNTLWVGDQVRINIILQRTIEGYRISM